MKRKHGITIQENNNKGHYYLNYNNNINNYNINYKTNYSRNNTTKYSTNNISFNNNYNINNITNSFNTNCHTSLNISSLIFNTDCNTNHPINLEHINYIKPNTINISPINLSKNNQNNTKNTNNSNNNKSNRKTMSNQSKNTSQRMRRSNFKRATYLNDLYVRQPRGYDALDTRDSSISYPAQFKSYPYKYTARGAMNYYENQTRMNQRMKYENYSYNNSYYNRNNSSINCNLNRNSHLDYNLNSNLNSRNLNQRNSGNLNDNNCSYCISHYNDSHRNLYDGDSQKLYGQPNRYTTWQSTPYDCYSSRYGCYSTPYTSSYNLPLYLEIPLDTMSQKWHKPSPLTSKILQRITESCPAILHKFSPFAILIGLIYYSKSKSSRWMEFIVCCYIAQKYYYEQYRHVFESDIEEEIHVTRKDMVKCENLIAEKLEWKFILREDEVHRFYRRYFS